ncbi:MAG: hypothetical protein HY980_00835 [Candidatus Magasanikbacteria bacterium]|nr:hypothetical protein [Candidatus Magasanikbacteria bacterium]
MKDIYNFLDRMKPTDILSLVVVIGSFVLIGLGHDGVINSVLMAVVAFYFGIKTTPPKE